jgi:ketosteroid isomerase-like protein
MTMRIDLCAAVLLALLGAVPVAAQAPEHRAVRVALERAYVENAEAFKRGDVAGVMALRDSGFHTFPPNGERRDRAAMEQYTVGLLNGIRKWNAIELTIDSLTLSPRGDTAIVIMSQHLDRMALRPDDQVHRVETWATQRETWVRHGGRWLLWRVDDVRDQRRLVDGKPA